MKAKRKWFLVVLGVVFTGYLIWILWPHLAGVQVTNRARLSEADVEAIVGKLEEDGMFYGRGSPFTVISSLFDPRSRPLYFVEIDGTTEEVFIMAGYWRGELWGGGPMFRARKVDGHWVFEDLGPFWRS